MSATSAVTRLPTGTVTSLFTDIQGSTRLLRAEGDAWPTVPERQHRILREAVTAAGAWLDRPTSAWVTLAAWPAAPVDVARRA